MRAKSTETLCQQSDFRHVFIEQKNFHSGEQKTAGITVLSPQAARRERVPDCKTTNLWVTRQVIVKHTIEALSVYDALG